MRYAPIVALALAPAAFAQLNGTEMEVEQNFADSLTIGPYMYGQTETFVSNQDPKETWDATSPAHQEGYEHSVLCDYARFNLGDRAGTTTYFFIRGIDVQPENAQAFNSSGKKIGAAFVNDFGFFIEIAVNDILSGPKDAMVVAWDSEGDAPCYADLNLDGVLDLFDFLTFTNLFNEQDEGAD